MTFPGSSQAVIHKRGQIQETQYRLINSRIVSAHKGTTRIAYRLPMMLRLSGVEKICFPETNRHHFTAI